MYIHTQEKDKRGRERQRQRDGQSRRQCNETERVKAGKAE